MKSLKRNFVIDRLRKHLMSMTDQEHSICEVAARRGIFCRGFRNLSTPQLRKKFDWITSHRPGIQRAELDDLINEYQLARQSVLSVPFACDAAQRDRDACVGWDEFTEDDLARFYKAWYGEEIEVLPGSPSPPD